MLLHHFCRQIPVFFYTCQKDPLVFLLRGFQTDGIGVSYPDAGPVKMNMDLFIHPEDIGIVRCLNKSSVKFIVFFLMLTVVAQICGEKMVIKRHIEITGQHISILSYSIRFPHHAKLKET